MSNEKSNENKKSIGEMFKSIQGSMSKIASEVGALRTRLGSMERSYTPTWHGQVEDVLTRHNDVVFDLAAKAADDAGMRAKTTDNEVERADALRQQEQWLLHMIMVNPGKYAQLTGIPEEQALKLVEDVEAQREKARSGK